MFIGVGAVADRGKKKVRLKISRGEKGTKGEKGGRCEFCRSRPERRGDGGDYVVTRRWLRLGRE